MINNTPKSIVVITNNPSNVVISTSESRETITHGQPGPPGSIGPSGPPGPQGPPGIDANYVHEQAVASNIWIINHNLGKYPSVTVVDSAGEEYEGDIIHNNTLQCIVSFSNAFSGRAFLN